MEPQKLNRFYQVDLPEITPLQKAMLKARTPCYPHAEVDQYKFDTLMQARRRAYRSWTLFRCGLLLLSASLGWTLGYRETAAAGAPWWVSALLAGVVGASCSVILLGITRGPFPGRDLRWSRYSVGYSYQSTSKVGGTLPETHRFMIADNAYAPKIPAVLKERCRELYRAGAECSFVWEVLDRDPLLWAVYDCEEYCIGVHKEGLVL
jgi:hypothetical protein